MMVGDSFTFTVEVRATGSQPPNRELVFSFGDHRTSVVLRDNSLFAARATQEMGLRFSEFLGFVRRGGQR